MRAASTERPTNVIRHLIFGLNPLIEHLEENDVDVGALLDQAKIPRRELKNPRYQLTSSQELCFTEAALSALERPDLGLDLGQQYHVSSYGMLGLAALTSENLYDAFALVFKYIQMTWSYMNISLETSDDTAMLIISKAHDLGNCYHYMMERDLVAAMLFASEIRGETLPLRQVNFSHACPDYNNRYAEVFGCDVHFDCDRNMVEFDPDFLRRPLPQAAEETSKIYEQQCQLICDYLEVEGSFTEKVRFQLIRSPQLICNLDILAERMFTTPRSVQRKLASEGTTFKALVEEIRRNIALEYLHQGNMLIEDIAERLGYSDAASFSHAFKRWTGKSPSATRQ